MFAALFFAVGLAEPKAHCTESPRDAGPCLDAHTAWTFEDGACVSFTWSGCGGNGNRFNTKRNCEIDCVRSQLVAITPVGTGSPAVLTWQRVDFPEDDTVDGLKFSEPNYADQELLGQWHNMEMETGFMLTARVYGDNLYGYVNVGNAPLAKDGEVSGGCCADTVRIWPKNGEGYRDVDILTPSVNALNEATPNGYAYPTHNFEIVEIEGMVVSLNLIQYEEPELNNAYCDAIVAISMENGEIIPTKDGDLYFSIYKHLGTQDASDPNLSIYKILFDESTGNGSGLGYFKVDIFGGTQILAVTNKKFAEVVLMLDPWTYATADMHRPGGSIVQRFGTPMVAGVQHKFGVDKDHGRFDNGMRASGVHNVFHTKYPDGRETCTIFVNAVMGSDNSWVYEFDIRIAPEFSNPFLDYNDQQIFGVNYVATELPYSNKAMGGARPIGNSYMASVWLSSAGTVNPNPGLVAIDSTGSWKSMGEIQGALYDTFTFMAGSPADPNAGTPEPSTTTYEPSTSTAPPMCKDFKKKRDCRKQDHCKWKNRKCMSTM